MKTRPTVWMLLATVLLAARPAGAQETSVTLAAGASSFDLSGTGTAPVLAVRVDRELHPRLRVEGGLAVARPEQQFGATTTLLTPEAQLQWNAFDLASEGGTWRVEPYLGLGTGWAWDVRPDMDDRNYVSFSGALGVRVPVGQSRGGRPRGRVPGPLLRNRLRRHVGRLHPGMVLEPVTPGWTR